MQNDKTAARKKFSFEEEEEEEVLYDSNSFCIAVVLVAVMCAVISCKKKHTQTNKRVLIDTRFDNG